MLDTLSKSHMDIRDQQIANLMETNEELRERNRQLEKLLVQEWEPDRNIGLSQLQSAIVRLLVHRRFMLKESIITFIFDGRSSRYGGRPYTGSPPDKLLRVHLVSIRKKLLKFDIHVINVHGEGYYIPHDDRKRLLAGDLQPVAKPGLLSKRQKNPDKDWAGLRKPRR